MKHLCDLEERHGVDIGGSYRNDYAYATFVKFIALDLQQWLKRDISNASIQIDSSTDSGNMEEELFLVLHNHLMEWSIYRIIFLLHRWR